jgi:hypothetical protein
MDDQATGEAFSLKREHPALQNMIFLLWVIFALLNQDPNPHSQNES